VIAPARARRWPRVVGAALVLLAASIWPLQHAGTALVIVREIDQPDAIVSLASHEWERLPETAVLARKAPKARVLLTQPFAVNAWNCQDCGSRIDRLVASGVARERIDVLPRRVYRTTDEAEAVRQWVVAHRVSSLMVVTSPYHTRRAFATFRHLLVGSGVAVGVQPASKSPAVPARWWTRKYDRWYVNYEWRARFFYLIRFRIW
jgi:uncharacterized SAM-binding protein YcdF (DUF218 family)